MSIFVSMPDRGRTRRELARCPSFDSGRLGVDLALDRDLDRVAVAKVELAPEVGLAEELDLIGGVAHAFGLDGLEGDAAESLCDRDGCK
jgi:hypothetical protein